MMKYDEMTGCYRELGFLRVLSGVLGVEFIEKPIPYSLVSAGVHAGYGRGYVYVDANYQV